MACRCNKKIKKQRQASGLSNKKVNVVTNPQQNNPTEQSFAAMGVFPPLPETEPYTEDRRKIEAIRREKIRRTLGIG